MLDWLIAAQRSIYTGLSADLSAFASTRDWIALASVLPLGIVFGAVHALTPGHGKSVLAAYLAGSRLKALRGMAVAGVLALTHVGSAVVLALLAAPLVTRTLGGVGRAPALETISRGALLAIGALLLFRAIRGRPHSHAEGEGLAVGVVAGLVPCPLTLFAMLFALSRGVPEAGVTFAAAMMLGVALTLAVVAGAAILARDFLARWLSAHGTAMMTVARGLDALAGICLVAIAAWELTR